MSQSERASIFGGVLNDVADVRATRDTAKVKSEIAKASNRLGVTIPHTIAELHRRIRGTSFAKAFNRFLMPDEWYVENGKLVFCEDNQGAFFWAAVLDDTDPREPAVAQAEIGEGGVITWHREALRLGSFITLLLHWQTANGGAPYCAYGRGQEDGLISLKRTLTEFLADKDMLVLRGEGIVVCALVGEHAVDYYCGASTDAGIDLIEERLGVEWEWSSKMEENDEKK